jgi:murein DD-endopeptidase MepM/ murein hydrolase activator NlpD
VSDPCGVSRGGGTIHTGIDLDLYGYHYSNIFAACTGTVIRTEYLTYSYGYHIVIDCGDGWSTLYAHLSQILVSPGQRVSAGEVIGVSGVTGYTTGEHLHFEIRIDGAPVNPAAYLDF